VADSRLSRRAFLRRLALAGGLLTGAAGLAAACSPAQAPSPTAPAAKPTDGPKPAAPTAAAKPAEAAKPTQAPQAAPAAKAKPEPKGSLVIALPEDTRSLQMWEGYSTYGSPVLRNVGESLTNRDPKTNQLVGELATRWEQTNPTTWRFTLRQGVKFHDGSPFNAEAAAFGLNHTWNKEANFQIRSFIGPELNAKPADEYTLEVTTEAPDPILPGRFYFSPIPSMKALKEKPDDYPLKPIGTGPYRFVEWAKGQHFKLEANPDWWGHSAADAHGAASIKDVTMVIRPEREVRTAMIQRSEADLARWVTGEQCKTAPQCASGPSVETIFLRMDTMHHLMKDRRIREAIALSIDKDAIINGLMGGGELAAQLVGPGAVGFNPNLKPYPYDLARAKQLVAEAKAEGAPVDSELTLYVRRGAWIRIEEAAEATAEMIKQAGLPNINARVLEVAAFSDLWSAPKPISPDRGMLGISSHGNEILDLSTTARNFYTCDGRSSGHCDTVAEEMGTRALPLTGEARDKAYQELAKYIYDDYATVPIGYPTFYFGLTNRLQWAPRRDGLLLVKEMALKE
jgi:peptide/nickel transport system substrate-binding protein